MLNFSSELNFRLCFLLIEQPPVKLSIIHNFCFGCPIPCEARQEDKSVAFLVSKEKFKVFHLKIKGNELNALKKRYLSALREEYKKVKLVKRYGKRLYEKLIKPMETKLKPNQTIIIAPFGELERIPFESFVISKKKSGYPVYLLEKYRIQYIQSASVLSVLRKHYRRDRETKNFIGFSDPIYDYKNYKKGKAKQDAQKRFDAKEEKDEIKELFRGRYFRGGGKLDRLKARGEEVNTIARLFKERNHKSVVYTREQTTEENAKSPDMKQFDYIHFATHGVLADEFQSLVLSQDIPGAKEDGYFTLNEIMNSDYHAKLVVLSACETGSGKMYKGEGVTGMTRAVMYAGTPAVIASLWRVDDRATKELMVAFYRNILEKNLDKVEALRQAKLHLLKTERYSSPLFWSAFVMYGE
jgi:CHAT domain-containing protein